MAFVLGTIPKWYFVYNNGTPLASGQLFSYRQDNKTELPIYADAAGALPYDNPINIDGNGTAGPLYFDDSIPYYLVVREPPVGINPGALVYDIPNYTPPQGSGGGSTTTVTELKNLVVNNTFLSNITGGKGNPFGAAPTAVVTTADTDIVICPSSHRGLNNGNIRLIKGSTVNTDSINFLEFPPGETPFSDGGNTDATPVYYLRYICSTSLTENPKYIQIPLTHGAKNLEGKTLTVSFWAKANASFTQTIGVNQYFGQGTNSPTTPPAEITGSDTVTTSWTEIRIQVTLAETGGATYGNCGNDGLFLRFYLPQSQAVTYDLALPSVFVGTDIPAITWQSENEVASLLDTPRTGDVRLSMNRHFDWGWVCANNQSIGSAGSSATGRAALDTFPLYDLLWNSVSDTYAPVAGGRGASSVDDFGGDKAMTLTGVLGRVLAGLNPKAPTSQAISAFTNATNQLTVADASEYIVGTPLYITTTGAMPTGLTAGVVYYAIPVDATHIQLAASLENASVPTPVTFSDDGTGPWTMWSGISGTAGEGLHTLSISEMPSHTHPGSTVPGALGGNATPFLSALGHDVLTGGTIAATIAPQGDGAGHNTLQPTSFMNVYLKL